MNNNNNNNNNNNSGNSPPVQPTPNNNYANGDPLKAVREVSECDCAISMVNNFLNKLFSPI